MIEVITTLPAAVLPCVPPDPVSCAVSVVGGALGSAGSAAGSLASGVAGDVMSVFVSSMTAGASWLVGHILGAADARPVDFTVGWYQTAAQSMQQVALVMLAPLLLAATIGSVLRQDLKRLGRIWGIGLPVAAMSGAASVVIAKLALDLTDSLTQSVSGGLDASAGIQALTRASLDTGTPLFVAGAIYLAAFVGAVFIWLEMLLRSTAVYVAMFFMPLALATYVWPATAAIAKRAVQLVVALILSKFVIFATLKLGMLAAQGSTQDAAAIGAGILLLGAFTPFALMRLAPIVEVAAIAHLEGMSRRPFHAASRAAATVAVPTHPVVGRVLASRGSKGGEGSTTPVRPQPLPARPADYRVAAPGGTDG